jgi:hypothetical protein
MAGVLLSQLGVARHALVRISIVQGWKTTASQGYGVSTYTWTSEYGHARLLRGIRNTV